MDRCGHVSMDTVSIDELADAVTKAVQEYTDDVTEGIKQKVDVVSDEVNEAIQAHITFSEPTQKYRKAFRIKRSASEGHYNKKNIWYVGGSQYRLTHLLEKGHALRKGGRTKAFPHIKYGEEIAQKRMVELSEEVIKNGH